MRRKLTVFSLAVAVTLSLTAFAQTGKAAGAPGGAAAASTPAAPVAPPTKVGIINIQNAILATNEGRRDFEALSKKYEPKQNELQKANKDVEDLKSQLNTQGDKMNEEARAKLVKQIDTKQRDLQHNLESAQADFQGEQNELANRIGSKVMQVLDKYARDNGYAVILDVSNPQTSPVLCCASVDVTEVIVTAYNAQSGVPAPAPSAPSASKPGPAAGATRPAGAPVGAAPARPKPAATTPTPPKQ